MPNTQLRLAIRKQNISNLAARSVTEPANMAVGIFRTLHIWLRFSIDAIFARNLSLESACACSPRSRYCGSHTRSRRFRGCSVVHSRLSTSQSRPAAPSVRWSSKPLQTSSLASTQTLRPLHLDCHGGAFIGGVSESDAAFCDRVARETGALVVSTAYRYAPRHSFPAAIDDVDAVLAYLRANADKYGIDPNVVTVSGFSAGGNLALATSLSAPQGVVKASVTFYAAIDLRLKPQDKPKPAGFPTKDPSALCCLYTTRMLARLGRGSGRTQD